MSNPTGVGYSEAERRCWDCTAFGSPDPAGWQCRPVGGPRGTIVPGGTCDLWHGPDGEGWWEDGEDAGPVMRWSKEQVWSRKDGDVLTLVANGLSLRDPAWEWMRREHALPWGKGGRSSIQLVPARWHALHAGQPVDADRPYVLQVCEGGKPGAVPVWLWRGEG